MKIMQKMMFAATLLFVVIAANAQNCNDNIMPTTPDSRFIDNGDGTVIDKQTNLIWMRCILGQTWTGTTCTDENVGYTWQEALQTAVSYSFAGSDGWRVPNSNELESIVERACYKPAINLSIFPQTPSSLVWTTTPYVGDYNGVWIVDFEDGYEGGFSKTIPFMNVRLVRSDID